MHSYQELFYNDIRKKIISGEYKIGEKLPTLRELSSQYNLGKTTVHSGIVELERAGFVVVEPRFGVFVNDYKRQGNLLTLQMLMEFSEGEIAPDIVVALFDLKAAVEPDIIRDAVERRTDEELENLNGLLATALEEEEMEAYIDKKIDFYHYFWSCSNNLLFVWLFNSFKPIIRQIYRSVYSYVDPHIFDQELGDLLDAMRDKNGELAYNLAVNIIKKQKFFVDKYYHGDAR